MFQPLLSVSTALALIARPTQRKIISKSCVFQTCFPVLFVFVYLKRGLTSGPGSPKVTGVCHHRSAKAAPKALLWCLHSIAPL